MKRHLAVIVFLAALPAWATPAARADLKAAAPDAVLLSVDQGDYKGEIDTLPWLTDKELERFINQQMIHMADDTVLRRAVDVATGSADWPAEGGLEAEKPSDRVSALRKRVTATRIPGTCLIAVVVDAESPAARVALANAVAEAYMAYQAEARSAEADRRITALRRQLADVDHRLAQTSKQLRTVMAEHPAVVLPGGGTDLSRRLEKLLDARVEAELGVALAALDVQQLQQPEQGLPVSAESELLLQQDAQLARLGAMRADLLVQQAPGAGDAAEKRTLPARLEAVERMIEARRNELTTLLLAQRREAVQAQYAAAAARFQRVDQMYQQARQRAADYQQIALQFEQLRDRQDDLQRTRSGIERHMSRIRLESEVRPLRVTVVRKAAPGD